MLFKMTERLIVITNRAGIHARPAAVLVQAAKDFKSNIYLEKGNDRVNAKSIMGILTLAAIYNTELKIMAEGEDEEKAVETIARLFETKFEEE
jgi:phosphocarrier protein